MPNASPTTIGSASSYTSNSVLVSGAFYWQLAAPSVTRIMNFGWSLMMPPRPLGALVADGVITYIPLPPALAGKYQSFTEADLARLRAAGYTAPMCAIDVGVPRYVERLISGSASSA